MKDNNKLKIKIRKGDKNYFLDKLELITFGIKLLLVRFGNEIYIGIYFCNILILKNKISSRHPWGGWAETLDMLEGKII